jgi:hypothetical protein
LHAWAKDPHAAATELYDELRHEGGDRYVVVRADVVDYHRNVVIAVDAASDDGLMEAYDRIAGLEILQDIEILRVVAPVPDPPHIAHGYISHADLALQHEKGIDIGEYIKAGRQGASPGHNAWG